MEVAFRGHYEKKLFFQAVSRASQPSRKENILRIAAAALAAVLFIAAFLLSALKEDLSMTEILSGGRHLIALPIIEYVLLLPFLRIQSTANALWRQPEVKGQIDGLVTGQGITLFFPSTTITTPWKDFARLRKTDDFLALLTADGILTVLPRTFFQVERDWNTVKGWADANVVEAK